MPPSVRAASSGRCWRPPDRACPPGRPVRSWAPALGRRARRGRAPAAATGGAAAARAGRHGPGGDGCRRADPPSARVARRAPQPGLRGARGHRQRVAGDRLDRRPGAAGRGWDGRRVHRGRGGADQLHRPQLATPAAHRCRRDGATSRAGSAHRGVPFFAPLSGQALERLAAALIPVSARAGARSSPRGSSAIASTSSPAERCGSRSMAARCAPWDRASHSGRSRCSTTSRDGIGLGADAAGAACAGSASFRGDRHRATGRGRGCRGGDPRPPRPRERREVRTDVRGCERASRVGMPTGRSTPLPTSRGAGRGSPRSSRGTARWWRARVRSAPASLPSSHDGTGSRPRSSLASTPSTGTAR